MTRRLFAILCTLVALTAQAATDIAGIQFEPTATVGGQPLVLNGAGLRTKFFFKVYAAGLYLPNKTLNAADAMSADTAKRIDLTMLRDVAAEKFVASLIEGLKSNQTPATLSALQSRIETFTSVLLALKDARKGQRFQMDYTPAGGTQLLVDGSPVGQTIEGEDFFNALLSVWVGAHPAQEDLKKALLGA